MALIVFYAYVSDLFIFRLSHILIKYGILGQPKVCGQRRALNKGKKKKTRSSRRAVGGGSRRREKESNLKTNPASIRQNSTRLKSRKRMEVSEIGFRLAAAASAPAAALVSQ